MPNPTPELGLQQAVDGDDTADYLDTSLAQSLVTIDSLFNAATGHTHGDVHQGGPIHSIPASAIPDGSITSAKLTDGTIQTVDLADGCVTAAKIATGAVGTAAIATGVLITTPTINGGTITSPAINTPTITGPLTITGAINSSAVWQQGPTTIDWFRVETMGQGIYNDVAACGIGFNAGGPFLYGAYGGGYLITESAAQTLTNKTINSPQINNPSIASPSISNPSISGTVSGAPAWANAQSFPNGSQVGGLRMLATHSGSDWIVDCGTIFFSGVPNNGQSQLSTNFNGAFSIAPYVVCQIRESSGGVTSVQPIGVEARSVNTSGFFAVVDNRSGGTQSLSVDWIAFGH